MTKGKWPAILAWVVLARLCAADVAASPASTDRPGAFVNSIGMRFVRIGPGSFLMGQQQGGDWDERPAHRVNIAKSFSMASTEVTNAQYELFDPEHRRVRGKLGFSKLDNEAVVFVSWNEAVAFCRWLSEKEGRTYRLP
ncbi:MAG: formylglycine-generating enzyme family protein, partial [Phycisphaerales bacterium]